MRAARSQWHRLPRASGPRPSRLSHHRSPRRVRPSPTAGGVRGGRRTWGSSWSLSREDTERRSLLAVLKALEIERTLGAEPVLTALRRFPAAAGAATPTSRTDLDPRLREVLQRAAASSGSTRTSARPTTRRAPGRDTVVVTPTASGKTLCYNLPVLDRILKDPDARALYLFPTKALAQDQLAELLRRDRGAGRRHRHLHLRRRHAAGRAQGHPRPRPRRGHQPRHAAQGHPARTTRSG